MVFFCVFFFKQKTAYEMRISDWSSDVCSSDLPEARGELFSWTPAVADYNSGSGRQHLTSTDDLVLIDDFGPTLEQCAAFALSKDGRYEGRLAESDEAMVGYGWYDRLPRITDLRFEIDTGRSEERREGKEGGRTGR